MVQIRRLGAFDDELEAARSYDKAALQFIGPGAALNLDADGNPTSRGDAAEGGDGECPWLRQMTVSAASQTFIVGVMRLKPYVRLFMLQLSASL